LNQLTNEVGIADICLKLLVFPKCFVLNGILNQSSFTGAVVPNTTNEIPFKKIIPVLLLTSSCQSLKFLVL